MYKPLYLSLCISGNAFLCTEQNFNSIMNSWTETVRNISENVAGHLPWQKNVLFEPIFLKLYAQRKVPKSVFKHLNKWGH